MPGPQKVDWAALEKEAVTENVSDREIARKHNLSNSTVSAYARANDWKGKKLAYQNALSRRSYEKVAESVANERAAIETENVLAARMYIRKFIGDLNEGHIKPNAKDALAFMQFLIGELVPPDAEKTETPVIVEQMPDADVLRQLVDAARRNGTQPRPVGPGPLVNPEAPRPN